MRRTTWIVIALLALLAGGVATWAMASRPGGTTTTTQPGEAVTTTTPTTTGPTTTMSTPDASATTTTSPTATTPPATTTIPTTTTTRAPATTTTTVAPPPGNHAPTVMITAPSPGQKFWASKQYPFGATITFTADAADADGDPITVEWFVFEPNGHSNQGLLGTGASISGTIYVQGADSAQPFITARVTDQWGVSSEHTIRIHVSIPSDT